LTIFVRFEKVGFMHGYTKLFGSIVASTIWREDNTTRIVWITMLALKDQNGVVEASIPGLADLARVSIEELLAALEKLKKSDPYSRTKEFEGRRIEEVDGGWRVLNHRKYREKLNQDERREYLRVKQQEHRDKVKASETNSESPSPSVNVQTPREKFIKPTIEEVHLGAEKIGLSKLEAEKFFSYYEANGWRVGKNPMKNWSHALSGWKMRSNEYGGSQNSGGSGKPNPRNFGVHTNTDYSKPAIPRLQRQLEEKARLAAEVAANGGGSPGPDQSAGSSV
jgi:hypothetical protein